MFYFLFDIPEPANWSTAQVANIIAIVSAIATVYAIWYAYARNRKQDKKINDLAEITKQLGQQNNLTSMQMKHQVRPNFQKPQVGVGTDLTIKITLKNEGQLLTVTKVHFSENTDIDFEYPRTKIESGQTFILIGKPKPGKILDECVHVISLYYHDVYENLYLTKIVGIGASATSENYEV